MRKEKLFTYILADVDQSDPVYQVTSDDKIENVNMADNNKTKIFNMNMLRARIEKTNQEKDQSNVKHEQDSYLGVLPDGKHGRESGFKFVPTMKNGNFKQANIVRGGSFNDKVTIDHTLRPVGIQHQGQNGDKKWQQWKVVNNKGVARYPTHRPRLVNNQNKNNQGGKLWQQWQDLVKLQQKHNQTMYSFGNGEHGIKNMKLKKPHATRDSPTIAPVPQQTLTPVQQQLPQQTLAPVQQQQLPQQMLAPVQQKQLPQQTLAPVPQQLPVTDKPNYATKEPIKINPDLDKNSYMNNKNVKIINNGEHSNINNIPNIFIPEVKPHNVSTEKQMQVHSSNRVDVFKKQTDVHQVNENGEISISGKGKVNISNSQNYESKVNNIRNNEKISNYPDPSIKYIKTRNKRRVGVPDNINVQSNYNSNINVQNTKGRNGENNIDEVINQKNIIQPKNSSVITEE